MCLTPKRLALTLVSFLSCIVLGAQTMYWVGGNGNFDDPAHWSLSPGGAPANVVPSELSDVVFTGLAGSGPELRVYFDKKQQVRSLSVQSHAPIIFVKKLSPARLVIGRSFDNPLDNKNFQTEVTFEFSNDLGGTQYGTIATGDARLSADLLITSGKWRIGRMYVDDQHGLYVSNASVHFYYSVMRLGHLSLSNCDLLNFDHSHVKVTNETKVVNCNNYSFKRAYLNWSMFDDSKPNPAGIMALASKKGSQNQINSLCIPTPTVIKATCSPGCDGQVIITLPPANCYTPSITLPYSVLITNGTCTNAIPASLSFVGPGTYTINNFCSCTADYIFYIVDGNGDDVESVSVPVPIPSAYANQSPGATTLLNCNGVCNGSVNLTYVGEAPFNFTITPPTGAQIFTNSPTPNLSVSGLCAGTLSVVVQDAFFCTSTFVRNYVWPPALNTNSVFSNITCSGLCNGSLNISPTGGTAGYTVNFNPGSSFTIGAGATVGTSGLCPGVVSATITDTKNCSITTSATVVAPPPLSVTVNQTSLACNSICNGSATVTISGGTPNYAYTLTPSVGAPVTGSTTVAAAIVNSLCAGGYTLLARDNNSCTISTTFQIVQPPAVTVTPTFTNIVCNGGCNGAITITLAGGNGGPHTYTWLPVGSFPGATNVSSLTALCANPYTINVRDVANCTSTVVINLTQPPALALTTATQALSCFGTCTGSGTVTATGGNPGPYSYTWSPNPPSGQSTPVISNLCGGTSFVVTVRDVSLCASTATVSIPPASGFTPNITTQTVTCNGACNGSINAAPTGTGTFNYTLASVAAGFTTVAAPPYINLCGGIYTLSMQNTVSGCLQTFTINVAQPNALGATISTTSLTCAGLCDGSASSVISGGISPYNVSWVTPANTTVVASGLTNICAGTYTLHVSDANGCSNNTITTTLLPPPSLSVTLNMTPASCNGNCDGALSAIVSGGTPPYGVTWSDGSTFNPNTNLCAGAYNVIVTDNNGCLITAPVTVTQPSVISISASVNNVNCSGGFTGSATVTASGGTPGFSYQFNNVPPGAPIATNTTGVLGGLPQGAYLVSATDANGCTQGVTFNITSPTLLTASVTGVVNSCNVCTGAATVLAAGGSTPYVSYAWTNSVSMVVGTASTVSGLCPGNYTVTITDNNGCITTRTLNIALVVNIAVVANGSGVPCFGSCTGFAVAAASGGSGSYTYLWNPGAQVTPTATGLCAGIYNVTVTDAVIGCVGTGTVTITQPASLTAVSSQTNVTCAGSCNGIISTTVSGGTAPITYSWTPAAPSSSVRTGLCAGVYQLQIRDNNLCTLGVPAFTITENPPLTATFTTQNPSACIANNGSICASASGGMGPYQYTWSPGNANTSCITGLSAGVYTVVVRDAANCTTTLFPSLINPAGPNLAVTAQSITCFGLSNGAATVTATGLSPFSFTWTPAASTTSNATSISATGLGTGTYIVAAADNNSCVTTQSIAILAPSQLTANATVADVTCAGAANGSIVVNPTGGTPPYSYGWSPGALPNSSVVTNLGPNTYTLVLSDSKPCSQTFTFLITEPTPLTVSTASMNVRCNGACNGSIVATASGGLGPVTYSWLPVGAFTGSATATVLGLCPNVYTVVASNPNCSATAVVNITEPPALTSTLILKNATCSNSCNAIATHSVSGGVPGYNYGWSLGASTASVLSGLCAGNYVASAADANNCIITKTFAVVPPSGFTVSLTGSDPLCNAQCNGSINTTTTGAQGSVNYNWSPMGSGQNPTGLCFDTYTLIATDDSLCVASAVVTLSNPPALLANVNVTNPVCAAQCNGVALSIPANASGTVSYVWSVPAPNSPNISGLCAGPYSVTLTDANGCQVTETFTVTDPPALVVNPSSNPSTCGAANGTITANVIGGTPAYSYTWLPPASGNSSVVTNVAAGLYSVVVSDQAGCTNTVSIILSNANGPDFVPITTTSLLCNNDCIGTASVNIAGITGGTPGYVLTWLAPAPSSTNEITNLCAGVYTLQVTDANACVLFTNVAIAEPPAVNVSPSFGLPTCMGTCDGSITLNASGGLGAGFTYTWLPSGQPNSPILTNACAGTYNVLIGDNGNNCIYTQTVTLPSQLNITASSSVTPNQCIGDCNGVATVFNPQGGVGPYTFNWSNGQTGPVATNLCTGTYTVIITDANGCFSPVAVTINALSQIVSTISVTSPSCGLCDGASNIATSGGVTPYSYTWTTGSNATSVSNLCAGVYQVIVTDALNCQVTETVIVNNSTGITGETFSITPLPCSGACNASASVTAQGGTAPITYNWISPAVSNSVAGGLCAGTYYVQMTDVQGCRRTASVDISPVVNLSLTAFVSPPGCSATDGTIAVDVAGGNLPYSVSWNPPAGSSATLTNIGQGSYTITVTEGGPNACSQTQVFNVSSVNGPVLAATQTDIDCFNACTGAISLTASGSPGPYTYNWSNGATTANTSGLCKGAITVTVTDNTTGCATVASYSITDNPQIQAGLPTITAPSCGMCNGSAALNIFGGSPAYTYTWASGSNASAESNLCAGLYQVVVRDVLGCQVTQTFIINNSSTITGETFSIQPLTCGGSCDGAATVTAIGGNPPVTYNWISPAVSGSVISNLCAGVYFVQMSDAQNCLRTASINLAPINLFTVAASITPPGCGLNDGALAVTVNGGVLPYTYSWTPAAGNTPSLTNIGQGTYTLTITDASTNTCAQSQQFNVSNSTGPVLSAVQTDVLCFGQCTGSLVLTASGSPGPFTFNWSNGATGSSVTNLCNGVITVTVTDNTTNCVTIETYTITENSQIQAGLPTIVAPTCGMCNGSAAVNVFGGSPAYTYTWTTGSNGTSESNLCAGIYQVVIHDALGCQATQTIILNNSNGITGETFNVQPLSCGGSCDGAATVTAVGGTAPISYNWVSPAVSGSVISNLCSGIYFVQMSDAQNCLRTASISLSPVNVFTVAASITPPGCGLNDGALVVSVTGGTLPYTYSWTPTAANTPSLTNIGQGTYTLTITDASTNTCAQSQQFNVSNSTGPVLSAVQTDVLCFGQCSGSVSLTVSGSPGPFTYNWSNGAAGSSAANLCSGVITVSVTDNTTNCVTIESYTITENPQIQAGLPNVTQPSCGLCNGAANLNVFGGSPAYSYTWSTGDTGPNVSNLCAGLYQVNVIDAVGCQVTQTIIINNSNGIAGETFSVQGLPCAGTCDGSATVAAVGGNGNITYTWLSPSVNGPVVNNLCAGDYFVQMQDEQGCLRTASVSVQAITTLTLSYAVTEPGCGLTNGAVEILISGGTPSYAINWQPVANTTETLSGIGQGTYTVTVTESGPNACSLTEVINVSNLNGPLVSATQTDVACFGACSGAISANASGTAAPFSYNWSIGGNTPDITNLCPGLINLSVTDANNCVTISTYTISENPALTSGAPQITEPGCNQCNGLATVNVFGGTLPYNIAWSNGGNGASTGSLCAGLYQILVTDALGCQSTQNVVINNPTGVTDDVFVTQDEVCGGTCNGSMTVTAIGGTQPITYNWIHPAVTGPVLTNLCPGDYFVQMTDATGCIRTSSANIKSTPGFTFTPVTVLPECGMSNGSIGVTVSGGIGPYTYSWSPVTGNTASLSNIGPGTYSLQISDGTSCTKTQIFTINSATAPAVTFTQTNIDCFESCTGAISVIASGSVAPFTYNWSNGATTPSVSGLCKGLVTLTVTTANSCVNIRSFTVTDNPELEMSLPNAQLPGCFGGCNGAITLIPSGGVLPYTFNWLPGGETTNPVTGICAGIYSVVVTDNKGCSKTNTVQLNNPAPITVTVLPKNASCSSVADGSIGVSVLGGTPSYSFSWSGPGGFNSNLQDIQNVLPGSYTLNIIDNAGCGGDTILVLAPTITITANAGKDTVLCAGGDVVLNGTLSVGALGYSWFLLPNNTSTVSSGSSFTVPAAAGSATYELVTSSGVAGCFARDTVVINVYPELLADAGPDVIIPLFSSVTIGGNPTSFSALSYTWSPGAGLNDVSVPNPVASNSVNTIYTVTVVDANGCFAMDSVKVELYPEVKIPNGFSPNGDGRNDLWIIDYIDQFPENTVEVYNRWGDQLFYSKGYQTPFNGKFKGKDLPVGTYYYIIHLNHPAYPNAYTGPLTIFR